jgi:8-oxo-dGTP diphosphatase
MIRSLFLLDEPARTPGLPVTHLMQECSKGNVPIGSPDVHALIAEDVVLVAGGEPTEVIEKLTDLRLEGVRTIYALDTARVRNESELRALADCLERSRFHFKLTEAIVYLLACDQHFVYAYPKADVAASVVVVFSATNRVLLIRRKHEPFAGMFAFPGGFLRPLVEDLQQCAVRELYEETGLAVSHEKVRQVSVRSNPNRDTRGHVIDHGYLVILDRNEEESVVHHLRASDDADGLEIVPISDAFQMQLAADHNDLLREAVTLFARQQSIAVRLWNDVKTLGRRVGASVPFFLPAPQSRLAAVGVDVHSQAQRRKASASHTIS